jgi:hypothetical protein
MNQQVQQQLREYRQFLHRIRTYCTTDDERKTFDDALAINEKCIMWLKETDTSNALKLWSKGDAAASKNYRPAPSKPPGGKE